MEYKTKGVCSMAIQYDLDDEQKVHNVKFIGGCSGNTQGVAKLVEGMSRPACNSFKRGTFLI